jgi:type I restriction enzyme M protein
MSEAHIDQVTRLFGGFTEAELVTVLDAAGQPLGETQLVPGADVPPVAPAGGRLKRVPVARIFRNEDFGYTTITVERPLRDAQGQPVLGVKGKQKGKPQPDSALRDTENVPLGDDVRSYFEREVLPHAPDAWIDPEKTKVGYEIPFNRHFYVFEPPRSLAEIDADLKRSTDRIKAMIEGLSA